MQTVQLKLENIRSIFETQQAGFRNLTDKHERPMEFVVPAPETLMGPGTMLFSPKHGKLFRSPSLSLLVLLMFILLHLMGILNSFFNPNKLKFSCNIMFKCYCTRQDSV
jgi:hypothetical protein